MIDTLPALAKLGYRYHDAIELPSWLFWRLSMADAKQAVRDQQNAMVSAAMAFGSYEKKTVTAIQNEWRETIEFGYRIGNTRADEVGIVPTKMSEKSKAAWRGLGGLGGGAKFGNG